MNPYRLINEKRFDEMPQELAVAAAKDALITYDELKIAMTALGMELPEMIVEESRKSQEFKRVRAVQCGTPLGSQTIKYTRTIITIKEEDFLVTPTNPETPIILLKRAVESLSETNDEDDKATTDEDEEEEDVLSQEIDMSSVLSRTKKMRKISIDEEVVSR